MEHEIEKLKKAYLSTKPPVDLEFYGFENVMERMKDKKSMFEYYRFAGIMAVVFLVLSGFAGITFASKPNSPLYPIKVAAQNAISKVAVSAPKEVKNAVQQFVELKKITPTPSPILPTPTRGVTPSHEVEKDDTANEKMPTPTIKLNIFRTNREVEGVSTSKAQEQESQNTSNNKNTADNKTNTPSNEKNQEDGDSQNQRGGSSEHSSSNSNNHKNN